MAINFDGNGKIEATTEDGIIAVKIYSLQKQIEEKDKEIEKLNHECDTYLKIATKRKNIIDELEKWLKEYKIQCKKYDSNSTIGIINCILNKLKELKEGKL